MTEIAVVEKSRYIWNIRALQLLREKATAQYALKTVPPIIQGVRIDFPEARTSLGFRVSVQSRRIDGRVLLDMIRDPESCDSALDFGIIALEALHTADVTSDPFGFFRRAFGYIRRKEVALAEMLGSSILSRDERKVLYRLASAYARRHDRDRAVLVHGDLHPSNIVVDPVVGLLGFVDLEMMHVGKPVTNFAQLWIGFQFVNPWLGRCFYRRYMAHFAETVDEAFGMDSLAEIALRCYSMIRDGIRFKDTVMEEKSRTLLKNVLTKGSFEEACLQRCAA